MERKPFPYGYEYPGAIDETPIPELTHAMLVTLAREIAMDINELEIVLGHHKLTKDQFERIKRIPAFALLLDSETTAWHSAKNTTERVKIQAAAAFEELLPVLHGRLTTKTENLNHVVAGAQLIADVAGVGKNREQLGGAATDRWAITINLGADQTLKFEKNALPAVEQPSGDTLELLKALPLVPVAIAAQPG